MAPKDLDKLIEKYLAGQCTAEENDLVNAWYGALGNRGIDGAPISGERISESGMRMLNKLQTHMQSETQASEVVVRSHLWTYLGIAASLIICLSAGFYFLKDSPAVFAASEELTPTLFASMNNPGKETKRVILPDGSIVVMDPGSSIRYSRDGRAPLRELFLDGEAYFDVARDPERPFLVYAGDIVTRVLGTSFIIRANHSDDKVTVSVKSGSVTVYSKNAEHKKTVLAPNQEAVYDRVKDVVSTQLVIAQASAEPLKNLTEMHFEETPVSEVLSMLNRAYDIEIAFDTSALSGCVLTSSFYDEGLYDRIDVICTAIGATYRIVDQQIVIESQGCNLKPA